MRRLTPRPLAFALAEVASAAAPATLLARVQTAWPQTAGAALAAATKPVAERDGVVTMACESAVWAQELELLAPDLLERLNERLGSAQAPLGPDRLGRAEAPLGRERTELRAEQPGPVTRLRFIVGSPPNGS
jgi:predicted nucleic acid-binding Zn ribbon protein